MTEQRIAELETELAGLNAQNEAESGAQISGGSLRTKSHSQRVVANVHRSAVRQQRIESLERQVAGLRKLSQEKASSPVTVEAIKAARLVRTRFGWHEVAKVNAKSVKVVAERGMDDLIPFKKIIEVR